MNKTALIRPAWTPATIALMVLGFVFFWPLGLAMLAYIIWGDRLPGVKHDINQATDDFVGKFRRKGQEFSRFTGVMNSTGNSAFDDWRDEELKRLDEERRKLDEARSEFEAHIRELRRARDREEFERFMAERRKNTSQDDVIAL
ncbi:MAG: DUF2852 domain-containing protein [Brucellaceae bacterium]|nr:DUF2852 domain-containing protein [Brucellaceae bacterium]